MSEIKQVTATGIPLLADDIDTDRIIPARYLRCVTFDGLGEHAFEDDRRQDPAHPFDDSRFAGAGILVSGRNFGCGSSREHAPQSLMRWGIQAVVAESLAEIFFSNCTSLGIPAVCANRSDLEKLTDAIKADPKISITINLVECQIQGGDLSFACSIPDSARDALITGRCDFLSQLLEADDQISATVAALPYMSDFAE